MIDRKSFLLVQIIKKIMLIFPDIKIVTVHDSLIFPKKWKNEIEQIFNNELDLELNLK